MLPRNQRQEALSLAYVQAVAAKAGVICISAGWDVGIDVSLRTVEIPGQRRGPGKVQLDLQLKSTTRGNIRNDHLMYDLDVKNYDDLRVSAAMCPRLLVVLVLPEEEADWLGQSAEELILRHCAYWTWLGNAVPTTAVATVRVAIPVSNVFSVAALQALIARLEQGELPC